VVKAYHDEIGFITPIVEDEIKTELTRSSPDWVLRAIGVAAMRNHRRWAYVAGILRRWHAEGYDGGVDTLPARTPNAARSGSKSTGYGRQKAPAMSAKGQSIEDYADDPEYYAQLKAIYAGGTATPIAAD
jgi:DnaD/phage-associated family protein